MKALSLHQPWAWLVVHGYKPIENRPWSTNYRGPVLIHASSKRVPLPAQDIAAALIISRPGKPTSPVLEQLLHLPDDQFGAIVGQVNITDCIDHSDNIWFTGPHGFILTDPIAYNTPIPYPGQLGLFTLPLNPAHLPKPLITYIDGQCPLLTCTSTTPHAHAVCPACGAVRFSNAICLLCETYRRHNQSVNDADRQVQEGRA